MNQIRQQQISKQFKEGVFFLLKYQQWILEKTFLTQFQIN